MDDKSQIELMGATARKWTEVTGHLLPTYAACYNQILEEVFQHQNLCSYYRPYSKDRPKFQPISVLDWGCGYADNTDLLVTKLEDSASAYKIDRVVEAVKVDSYPRADDILTPELLSEKKKFDKIILSNVLNIQPDIKMVEELIYRLMRQMSNNSRLFLNYPNWPRRTTMSRSRLEDTLEESGLAIEKKNGVYTCRVY